MAHVLVIDDNEHVRNLLRDVLQMAGHRVFEAHDGKEGLRQTVEASPTLVIVDMFMPGTDGISVIRTLNRENPDTKIIAMSGAVTMRDCLIFDDALELGAVEKLHKPFQIQTLLDTVQRVLNT